MTRDILEKAKQMKEAIAMMTENVRTTTASTEYDLTMVPA
jgi:hypothetical protein